MKVRQVEKALTQNGYELLRQRGSHRQYRKAGNPNVITVSGKVGSEMTPGELASIRRKTGLELR